MLIPRGLARLVLFEHVVSSFLWAWRGSSMIRMFVLRTADVPIMYHTIPYHTIPYHTIPCTMPTCVDNATENTMLVLCSKFSSVQSLGDRFISEDPLHGGVRRS